MDEQPKVSTRTIDEVPDVGTLLTAYTSMLEEWHRAQFGELGDDHRTVLLVLLGAEGYIASISSLSNWLAVIVVAGISTFGILLQRQHKAVMATNVKVSTDIAQICLELEGRLQRAGVFDQGFMHRLWFEHARVHRVPSASLSLHRLFAITFVVIPAALALTTLLYTLPATHSIIRPLLWK